MIQFKNISKIENISLIIGAIGYFLVIFLVIFLLIYHNKSIGNRLPVFFATSTIDATTVKYKYFSQLDGRESQNEADQIPQVVAVMVDNHPDARPQYGLIGAKVVYEAPVEGGFTRFMAVFEESQRVDMVGPVRSARLYYLDWLGEYGRGLYMHSGGSPDALSEINSRDIFDANEFYWGDFYWRSNNQYAPHNLFTKSESWQKIINDNAVSSTIAWNGWKFFDEQHNVSTATTKSMAMEPTSTTSSTASTEEIKNISIFYTSNYVVGWEYIASTTRYARYINNQPHIDNNDGSGITADNILIQYISQKVLDGYGRLRLDTIGSGEARAIRKGEMIRGTWKKESISARTRFYDKEDNEIILTPGVTWVQIIPENVKIEVGS